MAVPGSGTLTLLGLAQERLYGTYGSGTVSLEISMNDLINGGGPNAFPALNTSSPSVPSQTSPFSISDWYGYEQNSGPACFNYDLAFDPIDQFTACGNPPEPLYYSGAADPTQIYNNPLYQDGACSVYANFGWYANPATGEVAQWLIPRGQPFPSWVNIQPC